VCFSPWGEALSPRFWIVEGRADVRIGIRGSVVHIDRSYARIATVVGVGAAKHSTEARRPTLGRQQPDC
ncbi:hypothetical protein, partial [uncultured Muribaculum sp.]